MYKFKIPYKCLLPLVQQPQLLKAYVIYGKLKFMVGKKGFYYNYKSDKQVLADTLEISQNTLRKYVGILKEKGLAWESNRNLRLANSYKIFEVLGLKAHVCDIEYAKKYNKVSTKQFRLTYDELNVERIIALAIGYKQDQVAYNQKNNIEKVLKKEIGNIYCEKIRSNAYKGLKHKAEKVYDNFSDNSSYNFKTEGNQKYGFLDKNMCLETYTKMIGRKSKSTASRWLSKIQNKNYIKVERRSIPLYISTKHKIKNLRLVLGGSIFYNKEDNNYYKNLPNRVTVSSLSFSHNNLVP